MSKAERKIASREGLARYLKKTFAGDETLVFGMGVQSTPFITCRVFIEGDRWLFAALGKPGKRRVHGVNVTALRGSRMTRRTSDVGYPTYDIRHIDEDFEREILAIFSEVS